MSATQPRILLVDVSNEPREVLVSRLSAQGYAVETADDPATGADMALSAPPAVLIADLWMPSISGVQLCRLLGAEPATAEMPVILRGAADDPRSKFWAERAGAAAYVAKGRMGELVRVLAKVVASRRTGGDFFMQLSGGDVDVRERIARHLDAALFESVIAGEVRALASAGTFERLFDALSQLLSQLIGYRWMALRATKPEQSSLHCHPRGEVQAEVEARAALRMTGDAGRMNRVVDEDARADATGPEPIVRVVPFGGMETGILALAPIPGCEADTSELVSLVARELGGAIRMTALMAESLRLATIDPLTGLMNRRAFLGMMSVEVARARRYELPLSLLFLDVDHFKVINDGHGHAAGDLVLSTMGSHILTLLRTSDSPARWGGEEFIIALTNTDSSGARIVGDRVRQTIQSLAISFAGVNVPVTVSVGLATFRPSESLDDLVDRADRAMYAAKLGGRNRLIVSESDVEAVSGTAPRRDLHSTDGPAAASTRNLMRQP
jgi:two-component system cell cycle response regulator